MAISLLIQLCNLLKMRKREGRLKEDRTFQSTVTFTGTTAFLYATQNYGHKKLVEIKDRGLVLDVSKLPLNLMSQEVATVCPDFCFKAS